ncbi:DNA-binding domain of Mlu1-box binding protein MBP1 [Conidiobolus coronatus NRRL 28638]|uniref:DNA-binding domain of Mlu1-box binding protein MBP1 n=1 Tax=Conidiobolus coronatus (strain ATCC 28846 / CBS 209.66 / NRRL 28638) TaxID=796925 RepID=A0A137PHX0_CONC2|nr:DNA-binding domain of Mlu1-box binding protein MBP1 [Conidiobolus coronatus NRRL 28638]|eukprot:KXN74604.1 DNA-binding domain of Mlu1-box binding protein MBP1 [Conidiobolus coronatus NRRL 28638]
MVSSMSPYTSSSALRPNYPERAAIPNVSVTTAQYSTSVNPHGYLRTLEYKISTPNTPDFVVRWDCEGGHVFWTGIWKALGRGNEEVTKILHHYPQLNDYIWRLRGGDINIQGTWIAYEYAYQLAVRTCYPIRHHLTILFGDDFIHAALPPSHPQFLSSKSKGSRMKNFLPPALESHAVAVASLPSQAHIKKEYQNSNITIKKDLQKKKQRTSFSMESSSSYAPRYHGYHPYQYSPSSSQMRRASTFSLPGIESLLSGTTFEEQPILSPLSPPSSVRPNSSSPVQMRHSFSTHGSESESPEFPYYRRYSIKGPIEYEGTQNKKYEAGLSLLALAQSTN